MGAQMLGMGMAEFSAALAAGDGKARDARQSAKVLNFGLLYGMQAEKLALTAKRNYGLAWTEERAGAERARWVALHPGFESWWRRCEQHYKRVGVVRTLFGSYRHVLPDANKVGNTLVQSPATELVMRGLIDVDQLFLAHPEWGAELVAFVHDSGVVLRPEGREGEAAVAAMRAIMEHPRLESLGVTDLGIPLEVEVKSGRTWH
jgi:DNA polymerase-1